MICPSCLYDNGQPVGRCDSCQRSLGSGRPGPPPLIVGRAREMAVLDDQLQGALNNSEPRIVALVGQPGVGRSQIMTAFRRRHDNEFSDLRGVRGYCLPGHSDLFAPFGRLLRNLLDLDEREAPGARRARLRRAVAALGPASLDDALASLGYILGMSFEGPGGERLDPEERRRRAFASFAWCLKQIAARQPLLLLLEGLVSSTADGMALLAYLRAHLVDAPILALCEIDQAFFDHDPAFFQRYGGGVLPVEPLSQASVSELLAKLLNRPTRPPENLLRKVLEVTHGLPGGVGQVAATLSEQGVVPADGTGWGVDPDAALRFDFPLTAEEAARSRLDAMPASLRTWMGRAAIVGEVFWRGILVPLARVEEGQQSAASAWLELPRPEALDAALDEAVCAGILCRRSESSVPGEQELAFVQPQDRALLYQSLDLETRATLHAVVAQWLEVRAGDRLPLLLEIAEHYQASGNDQRAAVMFIMAGEANRQRFANEMAVEAFGRAVERLNDRHGALMLTDVHHALGALHALAGRQEQAEASFQHMLALAWRLDHRAKAGAALNRLGRLHRDRGDLDRAEPLLRQGRSLFEAADDLSGVAASIDDLGQVALERGDREQALLLFNQALSLRRRLGDERSISLTLTNMARFQRDAGYFEEAEATLREGLEIRQRIGDTSGVVSSLIEMAEVDLRRGQLAAAAEHAQQGLELARRTGDRGRTVQALVISALVSGETAPSSALAFAQEGALLAEQLGDGRSHVRALRASARAHLANDPDAALAVLEHATRLARQHGETPELGLLMRLRAAARVALSSLDVAEAGQTARGLAAQQEAATDPLAPLPAATSNPDAIDTSIGELISETLEGANTQPPQVMALADDQREQLELALNDYHDAVGVLQEVGDDWELSRTLRAMAELVAATGDVAQADVLLDAAEELERALG